MVRNYNIDPTYYSNKAPHRLVDMADFIWHEICMASMQKNMTFLHAPFIQRFIESIYPSPIAKTAPHTMWTPRDYHDEKGKALAGSSSRKAKPFAKPFAQIDRFLGKSKKAIFDTCRYTATHVATQEVHRITEANAPRARLRTCAGSPVKDDEPCPARLPLPEVDFPSVDDYTKFFTTVADDEDDDDDEDGE